MDVIDLTDIQRRGLLKKAQDMGAQPSIETPNFLDLTLQNGEAGPPQNPYANPPAAPSSMTPPHQQSTNPLAFLDDFAKAAVPTPEATPQKALSATTTFDPTELADMGVKLETFEYKLDNFIDKMTEIESKLKNFENKFS